MSHSFTPLAHPLFLSTLPARGATGGSAQEQRETIFLSTLPARGATSDAGTFRPRQRISIHAPREGSDGRNALGNALDPAISIHAPREGSDRPKRGRWPPRPHFYPRSPRGERRCQYRHPRCRCDISIHAPREGSDTGHSQAGGVAKEFLSTLPARGATWTPGRQTPTPAFLSTLPARGATLALLLLAVPSVLFLSTLPARGATASLRQWASR